MMPSDKSLNPDEEADEVHSMVDIDYDEDEWDNIDEFDVGVADMLQVI